MATRFETVFFMLLAVGSPCTVMGVEGATPQLSPNVNEMLGWLPVDAETLFVANGPFQISPKASDSPTFLESLQSIPVNLVVQLRDGLLRRQLQGHAVQTAIEGSRRFTGPKGLGMMPYEGCQILRFDDRSDDALKIAMRLCLEKADRKIRLSDIDVAVFKEKWENDEWSLFVARPRQGILLCATDEGFLKQVLERMKREPPDRALPVNLAEWRHVDVRASAWAIRHYRKETAQQDPSSPLRDEAAANVPDPNAKGFVFWYDAKSEKVAKASYLSSAKNAVEVVAMGWHHPSEQLTPKIVEIQPGVVEISAAIDNDRVGQSFMFVLWGYLGHGVYV